MIFDSINQREYAEDWESEIKGTDMSSLHERDSIWVQSRPMASQLSDFCKDLSFSRVFLLGVF